MTKIEGKAWSIMNDLEFGKGHIIGLSHPLLNRIAGSFVKAAGEQGWIRVMVFLRFRELRRFPQLTGLTAGVVYSGLTYGLMEARGARDWKNSTVAGALTGVTLTLTSDDSSHEQVVRGGITGAAISTAANLLMGIF